MHHLSMPQIVIDSPENITLLGGGEVTGQCLNAALKRAPRLVAADGGADAALERGLRPELVIGDMDSISAQARAVLGAARLHPVAEQDSTDFEKCLMRVRAPLVFGVGFLGKRLDHQLSVLNVLVRYTEQRCVLLGPDDVVFATPAGLDVRLDLAEGSRVSLFPLAQVTGESRGLRWPIAGIKMAPMGRIGTSNEVAIGPVNLQFDAPGMVVILPREALEPVVRALAP